MNKEQAKAWLPLIQAVAEGKTIQERNMGIGLIYWRDIHSLTPELMKYEPHYFRIKPEPKKQWYRVALLKNREGTFFTLNADSSEPYKEPEKAFIEEYGKDFVGWLTDRIEYELPEGEA